MTSARRPDKGQVSLDGGDAPVLGLPSPHFAPEDGVRSKGAGKGKRLRAPAPEGATALLQAPASAVGDAVMGDASVNAGGFGPSGSGGQGPLPADQVTLPLELNSRVSCRWKDGAFHTCRILERRKNPHWPGQPDDPHAWEYYVHWRKMNRRMDEWVSSVDIDLSTVELPAEEAVGPDGKKRKKVEEVHSSDDEEHGDFDPAQLREHEEFTKVKNIESIQIGCHEMDTWYFSPLPPEYKDCKKLYFCEFTLQFFKRREQMMRHLSKVKLRHPPGTEIYRKDNVAMFEVDGKKEKQFCQNLCFLAKLFLDHKTLYYDVDLFLFYVLCEQDSRGAHVVGYFSKEKCSEEGYNLACILTLPCYQRKGYGKCLISFSYELSKLEGKVGTPERPLSDLGLVSYRGYWTRVILKLLQTHEGPLSIKDISEMTAIRPDDIMSTLQHVNLIQYQKGQHVICAAPKLLEKYLREAGSPGLEVEASKIVWTPYNAEREYANYRP